MTGGILTFTIPQDNLPIFWRKMQARDLRLGSLEFKNPRFKKRMKPDLTLQKRPLPFRPLQASVIQGGNPKGRG